MDYQISAPASHAASVIFRNFHVREIGKYEATEENVAKIIDVCTQMFRIVPALATVVRSANWANPETLRKNLDQLREAVLALDETRKRLPSYADDAPAEQSTKRSYSASAPAAQAAKILLQHYAFTAKNTIRATEKNLAVLVDVCTRIFSVGAAVERLASSRLWVGKDELASRMGEMREALRAVELVRNALPTRSLGPRVVVRTVRNIEPPRLTSEQLRERQLISQEVSSARTVEEQQAVLIKAGFVKYNG